MYCCARVPVPVVAVLPVSLSVRSCGAARRARRVRLFRAIVGLSRALPAGVERCLLSLWARSPPTTTLYGHKNRPDRVLTSYVVHYETYHLHFVTDIY